MSAAPCQRAASRAAGSATTRSPCEPVKRGHDGPPGRRTGVGVTTAARPSISTSVGNGVRRSQPSISALPSSGDVHDPVTLPTTSPADQIGAPSAGAGPGIEKPTQRRWSGSFAVRSSDARPMNRGFSIRTAQSIPSRRGVVSSSVSMPTMTWPFSSRSPNSAWSPCGPDAQVGAEVEERPPQLDRTVDRVVELEGGLAGERQAHDVAGHARDVRPDVAEEARRVGQAGALEEAAGERSGDVDRGERHRPVEDVDAKAPDVDPVADPHLGVGRAAGRERQDEARLRVAQDHPVVHDVAALVEEQRVARSAGLDVRDVARVEALEQLDDVRPRDDQLAERRDVADRDALADGPVLRDRIAVVPRPPPATEPVHPGSRGEVLVMERASFGTRRRRSRPRPRRG